MFIEKTKFLSDLAIVENEVKTIENLTNWYGNQIGLKHRLGSTNIWQDCVGSLFSKELNKFIENESAFNNWNLNDDSYIKHQITLVCDYYNLKIGRVRLMRLPPHQGLSVHYDTEERFHLVIKTNLKSYICHNTGENNIQLNPIAQCYHLPLDGYWYKVKTTEVHWVYNGGETDRIHLVVCAY